MATSSSLWEHCCKAHQPSSIAIKLTAKGERSVRQKHPWIFDQSIIKTNKNPASGDVGIVFSHKKNKVLGVGLMDPSSPITLKMLHFGGGAKIDAQFFNAKLVEAIGRRKSLKPVTNAMRLVFGENDALPGLIVDQYSEVIVIKIYSLMWLPYVSMIQGCLIEQLSPKAVILRGNRQVTKSLNLTEDIGVELTYGELTHPEVEFHEYGVRFLAHLIKGHKTGFFLDHRDNRNRVGQMAAGKTVLDVFAYAGGFGVHALVGGAKSVTSLDISAQALELAKNNAQLNDYSGKHLTLQGDAFKLLKLLIVQGKTYDLVVIDPPSFAKSADGISLALSKYAQLTRLGLELVAKKGQLVLASCSSRITMDQFLGVHSQVFKDRGVTHFSLAQTTGHDVDHPIGFEQGAYLKTAYYQDTRS